MLTLHLGAADPAALSALLALRRVRMVVRRRPAADVRFFQFRLWHPRILMTFGAIVIGTAIDLYRQS